MANSRSARKRIRASERKYVRNRAVRSAVRTYVAKARQAALTSTEDVDVVAALRAAVSALDRAAEKGILHRNNVNRRKSRLTSMAARILSTSGDEQAAARAIAAGGQKGTGGKTRPGAPKRIPAKGRTSVVKASLAKPAAAKPAAAKKASASAVAETSEA